jgi:predicted phage tail protein|tara:strand:- start:10870 stop:12090 length:1221 start_codon:yes stop_codon:yes gene_type:complete
MKQTVRLLDDLGERYGSTHEYYDLRTPADAIKLLCINNPELKEELLEAHEHGVAYRLIQSGEDLGADDLHLPVGSQDLILVPVIVGSGGVGRAVGKIIAGVALVALSFVSFGGAAFLGGAFAGIGAGASAFGSVALAGIGASLILGGVADLLSPQPVLPKLGNNRFSGPSETDGPQSVVRGADGKQSYAYTGAANTVGIGSVIPVAYGEVLVGSNLISASIEVTDESDPLKYAIQTPGTNTVRFGGEKLNFSKTVAAGIRANRTTGGFPGRRSNKLNQLATLRKGKRYPLGQLNNVDDRGEGAAVLELTTGLFEFVSGPGTTLIDGFITYRLYTETPLSGPDPTTASSTATIQGLLLRGQTYRWVHRFENNAISDEKEVRFYIEIIDFDVAPQCINTLIVRSAGFM